MATITEDYVSFETAKLLKEKGYKGSFNGYYNNTGCVVDKPNTLLKEPEYQYYERVSLYTAMKWLREVHNKIIIPSVRVTDPITGIIDFYCIGIYYIPKNNGGALCFTSPTPENGYSSYEEACEAAIKYCLENLI